MTEQPENFDVEKVRTRLFKHLDDVLSVAHEKMHKTTSSDGQKQKWTRLLISAVDSYGKLLRDIELEDRVSRLETVVQVHDESDVSEYLDAVRRASRKNEEAAIAEQKYGESSEEKPLNGEQPKQA